MSDISIRDAVPGFDYEHSVGLFVGVRHFYEGNEKSKKIQEVKYAADDAVDLAHLFSYELKLIQPKRIKLALSSGPQKEVSRARLEQLVKDGAERIDAEYVLLLRTITEVKNDAGKMGYLIVMFATHGYTQDGDRLLCQDSILTDLQSTGLPVARILDDVATSMAPQRLVLIDACRERIVRARTIEEDGAAMHASFTQVIGDAKGMAVLSSAVSGGFSYDDDETQNGVFTGEVIRALKEGLSSDESGFVTPESLAKYVNGKVVDWVKKNRPEHQDTSTGISYNVDNINLGKMPLALSRSALEQSAAEQAELEEKGRWLDILKQQMDYDNLTGEMTDQIAKVVKDQKIAGLDGLTKRLGLLDEKGDVYREDFCLWWRDTGRGQYSTNEDIRSTPELTKVANGTWRRILEAFKYARAAYASRAMRLFAVTSGLIGVGLFYSMGHESFLRAVRAARDTLSDLSRDSWVWDMLHLLTLLVFAVIVILVNLILEYGLAFVIGLFVAPERVSRIVGMSVCGIVAALNASLLFYLHSLLKADDPSKVSILGFMIITVLVALVGVGLFWVIDRAIDYFKKNNV